MQDITKECETVNELVRIVSKRRSAKNTFAELGFKNIELSDKDLVTEYLMKYPSKSCERAFANIYLWSYKYPVTWAIIEKTLVFKSEDDGHLAFAFPAGEDEDIKNALNSLEVACKEKEIDFALYLVTPENYAKLENWYPGKFSVEYDRDSADYVYEMESLATLAGKKLHGKRNHINHFLAEFTGRWTYEAITDENVEDCFEMALKWRKESECEDDPEKAAEVCVTLNSLRLLKELDLRGGCLRLDGKIVAFTVGEPLSEDTFVVHIEKAYAEVNGAYPMINQQFILHECANFKYINREEDTGSEGLRQAKMSYRPAFMVEKGQVNLK